MKSPPLTERDLDIIAKSLRAAADGPFFPDWEFETLTGATRDQIRSEADAWLRSAESSREMRELAISVISNLLGYPHDQRSEVEALIGADCTELTALNRKLST